MTSLSAGGLAAMVTAGALAIGCGGHDAPPVAAAGSPARATSSAAPGEPAPPCSAAPRGLDALLHPGALVVFGEIHGTAEAPAFVANAACHAAAHGTVAVGLEIARDLQPVFDRFLDSRGEPDDVTALLQADHWDAQDGRASKAMFGLLEQVRALRHAGKQVRVFLFDRAKTETDDRDQSMAAVIAAQADMNSHGITLVLTGNLHAKADTERWMSWHIAKRHSELYNLNIAHSGGTAYVCHPDHTCGAFGVRGEDLGTSPFVEWFAARDSDGYGGRFYVGGAIAASPPMKPAGSTTTPPPAGAK